MSDFPLTAKLNFQKMLSFILICCFVIIKCFLVLHILKTVVLFIFVETIIQFLGEFLDVIAVTFDAK